MIDPDKDNIERLKRKLTAWDNGLPPVRHSPLDDHPNDIPHEWPGETKTTTPSRFLESKMLQKILMVAIVFFILMGGVAAWVFYRGDNVLSTSEVSIDINGPLTIRSGEQATLEVSIANKNASPIELVDLIIEYPPGARATTNVAQELTRERRSLGTIKAGATAHETIKALLYGEKDSNATVKTSVQYRFANSNAIFTSNKDYAMSINSSPVDVSLDLPDQINANQELTLKVEVTANAQSPIANPIVIVNYPSGFQFKKSSLAPTHGTNVWQLDKLTPGKKVSFTIQGSIVGQDSEGKAFRVEVGSGVTPDDTTIALPYGGVTKSLTIRRSALALSARINNSADSEYIATSRQPLQVELSWLNNLASPITDGELTVKFTGDVLDKTSVKGSNGFYQGTTNVMTWNKTNNSSLGSIAPSSSGTVNFSLMTQSLSGPEATQFKNPAIDLLVTLKGRRLSDAGGTEPVESTISRKIKVNSVVQLAAQALYKSGSLSNTGPLPPKVDQETTYTLVWSLVNSSNDLKATAVKAVLPPYMRWVGTQNPANERLVFTAASGGGGEVLWDVGAVKAGTGLSTAPREVSFQVALKPSVSQVGEAPVLINTPGFSAQDSYTGDTIEGQIKRPITTYLSADPQFVSGQDKVVQ